MKKPLVLVLLLLLAFIAFPKTATKNKSVARSSNTKPSLSGIICKLDNEIADITLKRKKLICDDKKLMSEENTLMNDLDKVIRKINKKEITCQNNEIKDIVSRIGHIHDKSVDIGQRNKKLNYRKKIVECQLEENPRLQDLVHIDHLYELGGEWNDLMREDNPKTDAYNDKANEFISKANTLPACP